MSIDPLATARIPLVGDIAQARPPMIEHDPTAALAASVAAFAPYRDQTHDCACDLCMEHGYTLSRTQHQRDLGYRDAWEETQVTAGAVLAALRAGTHQRVTYIERFTS